MKSADKSLTLAILAALTLAILAAIGPSTAHGQDATQNATQSATATINPNPELMIVSTLPSGQATALVYTATAGQLANLAALAVLVVLGLVGLFLQVRSDTRQ